MKKRKLTDGKQADDGDKGHDHVLSPVDRVYFASDLVCVMAPSSPDVWGAELKLDTPRHPTNNLRAVGKIRGGLGSGTGASFAVVGRPCDYSAPLASGTVSAQLISLLVTCPN